MTTRIRRLLSRVSAPLALAGADGGAAAVSVALALPAFVGAGVPSDEVRLRVALGAGDSSATAWGCDLTPEYVRINREYTT